MLHYKEFVIFWVLLQQHELSFKMPEDLVMLFHCLSPDQEDMHDLLPSIPSKIHHTVLVKHLEYQVQSKSQPTETVFPKECVEPAQTRALYFEGLLPESCWGI